ncbi:MAG: hypothetical protein GX607_09065 [Myxococcales bacterium]|jgi:hypothetical protein|nr:hypothetical protein [Myxococcales bacterium]
MQLAVAGGAAGLLACGEVGDEYLDGDGRRLVTWHLSAPGVPPGPGTPWDTVLHSPCSFTTAGDGALRCLPRDGALQSFPADAPQLFADPACSQRLYWSRSEAARCASPPVALASHGCRAHVHQVTLHDLAAPIFTSESRTCQAASPESLARLSGPSFGLGAAIPPSHFEAGTRVVRPLTPEISELVIRSAEGVRESRKVFLAEWGLGLDCGSEHVSGGQVTCRPDPPFRVETLYLDADCTDPVDVGVAEDPCADPYAEPWALLSGPDRDRYFAITGRVSEPLYARALQCSPASGVYHALGIEATIPRVTLTRALAGTGRLRRIVDHQRGVPIRLGQWFDEELQSFCQVLQDRHGAWRCFPFLQQVSDDPGTHVYADAARSVRLIEADAAPGLLPESLLLSIAERRDCAASVSPRQIRAERQVTAVHRVGYRHLGLVYDDAAAPRAPGATAYFTLHEVPLTDFPHLALVVE